MKKIIITLALCSAMLGMASCTRGGNIDRGDDGFIGHHGNHNEGTTDVSDTGRDERRYEGGIGDDIYNLPRDIRRGLNDAGNDIGNGLHDAGNSIRNGINGAGDDVHNGLRNAEDNLRRGLNLGGDGVRDNNMIK